MPAYCVTYDLRQIGQRYKALSAELEKSPSWWHDLDSAWLIRTDETPDQVVSRLRPALDANDYLLVIEVCNNAQGFLPAEAWDWIDQNVPA